MFQKLYSASYGNVIAGTQNKEDGQACHLSADIGVVAIQEEPTDGVGMICGLEVLSSVSSNEFQIGPGGIVPTKHL